MSPGRNEATARHLAGLDIFDDLLCSFDHRAESRSTERPRPRVHDAQGPVALLACRSTAARSLKKQAATSIKLEERVCILQQKPQLVSLLLLLLVTECMQHPGQSDLRPPGQRKATMLQLGGGGGSPGRTVAHKGCPCIEPDVRLPGDKGRQSKGGVLGGVLNEHNFGRNIADGTINVSELIICYHQVTRRQAKQGILRRTYTW